MVGRISHYRNGSYQVKLYEQYRNHRSVHEK